MQSFLWVSIFTLGKLKDNKVCIRLLHTLKVCNLFFGGIFSHTYLLKSVHFGTWAVLPTLLKRSFNHSCFVAHYTLAHAYKLTLWTLSNMNVVRKVTVSTQTLPSPFSMFLRVINMVKVLLYTPTEWDLFITSYDLQDIRQGYSYTPYEVIHVCYEILYRCRFKSNPCAL